MTDGIVVGKEPPSRSDDVAPYPWPLQPGHLFGPTDYDLRYHNGSQSLTDLQALARWQRAYYQRLNRYHIRVNGRFDGETQKAAVAVQELVGLPVTGLIDPATWEAVWSARKPPAPPPPVYPPRKRACPQALGIYWRRYSATNNNYGCTPGAPPWYPGKPFSRYEAGEHVRIVQEKLGLKPTGIFNKRTSQAVGGIQGANGLPWSRIVDVATARLIDPPPWDE